MMDTAAWHTEFASGKTGWQAGFAVALTIVQSETSRLDTKMRPAKLADGGHRKGLHRPGYEIQRMGRPPIKQAQIEDVDVPIGHVPSPSGDRRFEVGIEVVPVTMSSRLATAKTRYVLPSTFHDKYSWAVDKLESLGVQVVPPNYDTSDTLRDRNAVAPSLTAGAVKAPIVEDEHFVPEADSPGWILAVDEEKRSFIAAVQDEDETVDAEFRFDDVLDDEQDLIQVGSHIQVVYGTQTSTPGFKVSIPDAQNVSWAGDEMFPVDVLKTVFTNWQG